MKRIMTFAFALTIAAALALTTTSCSNEDILTENNEQPQVTTNGVQVTVGAGFDEATTRSAVVIDGTKRTLKFTTGDRLYINGEIGGGKYIAGYLNMVGSPTNDNKSAQFTGTYGTDLKAYSWNSTSSQYEETSHTFSTIDILGECSNVKAVLVDASSTFTVDPTLENYYMSGTFAGSASSVEDLITKGLEVKGDYVSASHSFTLSNNNTIFNCTFSGLAPSTTYKAAQALSDAYFKQYNFTTDANGVGTIAFIAAVNSIVNTWYIGVYNNNDTEVGSIPLGTRSFESKIYNITRCWTGNRFVKLIGKFTVNAGGKQVYFAPGNLQYKEGEAYPWRFAANQWDYVGDWDTSPWVDLFGWGTWTGNAPNPLNTSKNTTDYSWDDADFTKESLLADASQRNYDWRTLTGGNGGEWEWILGPFMSPTPGTNCRTSSTVGGTANARYAKATVVGTSGVIIFPDTYTHPGDVTAPVSINTANANFDSNTYDATAWAKMETAGCVFLPAARRRNGSSVTSGDSTGEYWTSSPYSPTHAHVVSFWLNGLNPREYDYNYFGFSVRLVRDVN